MLPHTASRRPCLRVNGPAAPGIASQRVPGGAAASSIRKAWRVLLALAAIAACACTPPPVEPLRVASGPWPGYEPIFLARDLGYLGEGRILAFELPSSSVTFEAFRNGSTDVATMSLNQFAEVLRSGVRARIVMVLDSSNGADSAMASPAVRSIADLKGKRIVIGSIAGSSGVLLFHMLDEAGIELKDVTIVTAPDDRHEQVFRQGRADVMISYEPFKTRLAALGAHSIYDSSRIPNRILDLLVVREEAFQSRRDDVCILARQWFRTLDYMKSHPDDSYARIGQRIGKSAQDVQRMLQGLELTSKAENLRLLGRPSPAILDAVKGLDRLVSPSGQRPESVNVGASLDPDPQACFS
jgi:NitT/TauT family transport system substrate-binding protein